MEHHHSWFAACARCTLQGDMQINPFLFLGKPKNVDVLSARLRALQVDVLRIEESDSAYHPARVILSHPSIQTFAIVFRRVWWPDGMNQEDDRIVLTADATESLICDVSQMLRGKFQKPLAQVIVDKVAEAVAGLIQSAR